MEHIERVCVCVCVCVCVFERVLRRRTRRKSVFLKRKLLGSGIGNCSVQAHTGSVLVCKLLQPNRLRLNRFGLYKDKLVKPKPNR